MPVIDFNHVRYDSLMKGALNALKSGDTEKSWESIALATEYASSQKMKLTSNQWEQMKDLIVALCPLIPLQRDNEKEYLFEDAEITDNEMPEFKI